tara:strand:+ start:1122 stop:1271 length:150 start_codon:yes stop_codon:yes gene_type:complete
MIKKVILTLFVCSILFSCGKKGDPEYVDSEKTVKLQINLSLTKSNEIYK